MSRPPSLRFPRPALLGLTLLDLALVALSALGIQDGRMLSAVPSFLLLAFSAACLLLLCREWLSPSIIEISENSVSVKWNNWRLRGSRLGAELIRSRPRRLRLTVGDPAFSVEPVGPLHLAAMYVVFPWLSAFLPPYLARIYFLDARKLSRLMAPSGGPALISFPASLFGKRRIRNALEKDLG